MMLQCPCERCAYCTCHTRLDCVNRESRPNCKCPSRYLEEDVDINADAFNMLISGKFGPVVQVNDIDNMIWHIRNTNIIFWQHDNKFYMSTYRRVGMR
jgi:hypothetical protein